jgi:hypothetical protein
MNRPGVTEVIFGAIGLVLANNLFSSPGWYVYALAFVVTALTTFLFKAAVDKFYGWPRFKSPFKKLAESIFKDISK